ncbi:PilZ domain-containing protein [Oceanispirochaeta sp.]|jgi:hypothetical protein|uniref:PilZ domain-containing protein n=1 Tax=Oceanispirochaeta sp. TaxID=2035350 RepID=UPI00262A5605|nr:PilZ domain-containing protein [Oceanispirochaeta sp.]MDA3955807.1 PilZ domain-containing protein [Oceanispirochaeta sp.]
MGTIESRKEKRIPVNELPEKYTGFSILLPHGVESMVYTIDASLNGFGFNSDSPLDDFIVGSRLVLYPNGTESPVYGKIVFSCKTDKGTRVGVQLQPYGGYEVYNKEIQEILAKTS